MFGDSVDLKERLSKLSDEEKNIFYESIASALQGVHGSFVQSRIMYFESMCPSYANGIRQALHSLNGMI